MRFHAESSSAHERSEAPTCRFSPACGCVDDPECRACRPEPGMVRDAPLSRKLPYSKQQSLRATRTGRCNPNWQVARTAGRIGPGLRPLCGYVGSWQLEVHLHGVLEALLSCGFQ